MMLVYLLSSVFVRVISHCRVNNRGGMMSYWPPFTFTSTWGQLWKYHHSLATDFFRFPLNLLSFIFSSNIVNIKFKSFTNMLNAWKDQRKVAPFSLHVSVVRYSGCPVCFLPWKSSVRHLGHHPFSSLYLIFSHHHFSYFFLIVCQNHF